MVRASLILSALLSVAGFATAATRHYETPDGFQIVLHNTKCASPVKDAIKEEFQKKFHRSELVVVDTRIESCWILEDDGDIVLVDRAGQEISFPKATLKKVATKKGRGA